MASHGVLLLAFPEGNLLDITGPLQILAGANAALGRPAYAMRIAAAVAGPLRTSSGIALLAETGFAAVTDDLLQETGTLLVHGGQPGLPAALAEGAITAILRRAASRVPRFASVCTGAFLLAAAGLLDGRRAATHWNAAAQLRRFRPQVEVDGESIWVRDGPVWTSAGVTAGIDLALALIEADHGRDLALAVAREHVVFRIRPGGQAQFAPDLAARTGGDPRLLRLAERIAAEPWRDWRTEQLAEEAGLSLRSLSRLFRRQLGASPAEFVERLRIDEARRRLLETDAPVERVAREAGFGSLRRMDRAFLRAIAASPSAFRARFRGDHA